MDGKGERKEEMVKKKKIFRSQGFWSGWNIVSDLVDDAEINRYGCNVLKMRPGSFGRIEHRNPMFLRTSLSCSELQNRSRRHRSRSLEGPCLAALGHGDTNKHESTHTHTYKHYRHSNRPFDLSSPQPLGIQKKHDHNPYERVMR